MTTRSKKSKRKGLSYVTGDKGNNRVRLFADPRRNGTLFLEYRDEAGKKKAQSLGHDDFTRGKIAANELAAELLKHEGPRTSELTLRVLFDKYDEEVKAGRLRKTPARIRYGSRTRPLFEACWGSATLVRTLDVTHWNAYIHERRTGALRPPGKRSKLKGADAKQAQEATTRPELRPVRNRIIEYDLRYFLAVCHWAERVMVRGKPLLERTPFKGLEMPKESSPARPILSGRDYEALKRAADALGDPSRLFLTLAHETGHRGNAIRQLRWSDVDTQAGRIMWRATTDKSDFEHDTRLTKAALEALKAAQKTTARIGDSFIFPADEKGLEPVDRYTLLNWWKRLERVAGLKPVKGRRWHCLRRKFANDGKRAGAPVVDLARMLGHKTTKTLVEVYQQPDEASMRIALENIERLRASGE